MEKIKALRTINKILVVISVLLGLGLLLFGQPPELPSSNPILPGNSGTQAREYLVRNLYAIVCTVASLTLSFLVMVCGLTLRRNADDQAIKSNMTLILGLFILVSGVRILTDSGILTVFTADYGGTVNKNAIVFVSYICFMLLPVIFLAFLQYVMQIKGLRKIDGLFVLNFTAFVVLAFFRLSKVLYFILLMIHHLLIYFLVIVGIVYFIRNYQRIRDKQEILLFRGLIFFMGLSSMALIVFFLNFHRTYAILYSVGFFIMIWYMVRLTVQQILSTYHQSVKYKSMAYTDKLTKLRNKNAFLTERYNRVLLPNTCCIVMDIKRLKQANDIFGHSFGDDLIRRSADIVYDSFSDIGVCYRIGGDEFAVICEGANETTVKKAINRMEARIAAANSDSDLEIGLACGYAFSREDTEQFKDLFNEADSNMYLDKSRSRYYAKTEK